MVGATGWAMMDAARPSIPYGQVFSYNEDRTEGHKQLDEALKRQELK